MHAWLGPQDAHMGSAAVAPFKQAGMPIGALTAMALTWNGN